MQLRIFLFLSFLSFAFSSVAQNYTGVWEGSFLTSSKKKMNVRIEVVHSGNSLHGVVTTREFEKNTDHSCVYVVPGSISRYALALEMSRTQRATSIRNDGCSAFKRIAWFVIGRDSVNTTSAVWYGVEGGSEEFVIRKTATEVSKKAREQMKVLKNKDENYSEFAAGFLGERLVENKPMSIIVTAVEKNPKASITVTLNGKTLADKFDLSKNVLVIRLKDIAQINNIEFINLDRNSILDVKISFQQEKEKGEWAASIWPETSTRLRLNRKD